MTSIITDQQILGWLENHLAVVFPLIFSLGFLLWARGRKMQSIDVAIGSVLFALLGMGAAFLMPLVELLLAGFVAIMIHYP